MQKYGMSEEHDKIIHQSKSILKECDLCDNCLGRFFINLSSFSSARRLGLKIRNSINSKNISECYICRNLFSSLDYYVKMMHDVASGIEFSTFVVGATLKQSVIERDDKIRSEFHLRGVDSIKTEITKSGKTTYTPEWIYESPDGGKTVYKRKFNESKKTLVSDEEWQKLTK